MIETLTTEGAVGPSDVTARATPAHASLRGPHAAPAGTCPQAEPAPRDEWPPRCRAALLPRGFFPRTLPDSHHESPDAGGNFEGRVTSSRSGLFRQGRISKVVTGWETEQPLALGTPGEDGESVSARGIHRPAACILPDAAKRPWLVILHLQDSPVTLPLPRNELMNYVAVQQVKL